jgi:hypothetical protein
MTIDIPVARLPLVGFQLFTASPVHIPLPSHITVGQFSLTLSTTPGFMGFW